MRQLPDDTHLILDGEVRVYRRERSKPSLYASKIGSISILPQLGCFGTSRCDILKAAGQTAL